MQPYQYQIDTSIELWNLLVTNKFVYLSGKPRFGKTLTALLTLGYSKRVQSILILCPKNAISGWSKFINDPELQQSHLTKQYTVMNYEAVGSYKNRTLSKSGTKLKKPIRELHLKINPDDYQAVIVDESHRLGKVGKPSQRHSILQQVIQDKPIILLSGTQAIEHGGLGIYYQMTLSTNSPFPHKSFYDFFRSLGVPTYMYMHGREIMQYKKAKPELQQLVNAFTIYKTQEDAGIQSDVQATDQLHYIDLTTQTKVYYNQLQSDKLLKINNLLIMGDTVMGLRLALHQLESGVTKLDNSYHLLGNTEKVDYIKQTWGDSADMGIMCNFVGERKLLQAHFQHANIYSSISHAEGVDLSHLTHFIIYSQGYSGSKAVQVRERIINTSGSATTTVHYLLVKDAISDQVYQTTKSKRDFNNSVFTQKVL